MRDGPILPELTGYTDRLDVSPGEEIAFMVSSDHARYDVEIVRLIHGDENPAGPGAKSAAVPGGLSLRDVAGARQVAHPGSYALVEDAGALAGMTSFSVGAWIFPTLAGAAGRAQAIVAHAGADGGFELALAADGCPMLRLGAADLAVAAASVAAPRCHWVFVAASYDAASGQATLLQRCAHPLALAPISTAVADLSPDILTGAAAPLAIGACPAAGTAERYFEGKIEGPWISTEALTADELESLSLDPATPAGARGLAVAWDFSLEPTTTRVLDTGSHGLHGRLVNCPLRAVTSHAWSGAEFDFRRAPQEYAAIHFHSTDLDDARWEQSFAWRVPDDACSAVYAARLTAGEAVDHIPFVVLPPAGRRRRVAVLLPTMTYLAYANVRRSSKAAPERPMHWDPIPGSHDRFLAGHPEYGRSTYDRHADGSSVCFSSYLRPVPNMRPDYRMVYVDAPRHLGADLYLIDWLEVMGFDYDVITDHHLHREGAAALAGHEVVITGSHPEYISRPMLDTLEAWVASGGRLMYLGGNGFYWLVSVHPEIQHTMEYRGRVAAVAERWHLNGDLGGLWTDLGRPAERLTGIGMAGQGFDGRSRGYRRGANTPRAGAEFVFRGIAEGEVIGEFGLVMNGAAGDEIDRHRPLRDAPPQTRLLASSLPHTEAYLMVDPGDRSEHYESDDNRHDYVRSDIVLIETEGGGRVFSAGSISVTGSLSFNGYRNNISRMVQNVLEEFLAPIGLEH